MPFDPATKDVGSHPVSASIGCSRTIATVALRAGIFDSYPAAIRMGEPLRLSSRDPASSQVLRTYSCAASAPIAKICAPQREPEPRVESRGSTAVSRSRPVRSACANSFRRPANAPPGKREYREPSE